jgi:hypothetical protein
MGWWSLLESSQAARRARPFQIKLYSFIVPRKPEKWKAKN